LKTIIVNSCLKKTRIKKKVERELRWYDNHKKKLLIFTGGKLEFDYIYDDEFKTRRTVPRVENLEIIDYENKSNIDEIKNWAKCNLNYSNAEIMATNKDNIIFNVPDNEVQDFIEALDDNNFEYSVE